MAGKKFKKKKNVTKTGCINKFYGHKDFFIILFVRQIIKSNFAEIFKTSQMEMKNFNIAIEDYISPEVSVIDILPEGVLCGSNEMLDQNEGEW